VIADEDYVPVVLGKAPVMSTEQFIAASCSAIPVDAAVVDDTDPAVLLFTSGTTSKPNVVPLRHENLLAYILGTVEFGSAAAEDAALVSPRRVPGDGVRQRLRAHRDSSTIALLGLEDHRTALAATDPVQRARLGSAGRPVPGIELQIRDDDGVGLGVNQVGELWVRGPQVSGEYVGIGSVLDAEGWFPDQGPRVAERRRLPVHRGTRSSSTSSPGCAVHAGRTTWSSAPSCRTPPPASCCDARSSRTSRGRSLRSHGD
jgi:hypothetical protein